MVRSDNHIQRDILIYLVKDARRKLAGKRAGIFGEQVKNLDTAFLSLEEKINGKLPLSFVRFHELFSECHMLYGMLGGVLTADHWQSPSFGASTFREVGDEEGKILANVNDYKRDMHQVGISFEKAYASEYLKGPIMSLPVSLSTVSGMAALAVGLVYMKSMFHEQGGIAIGEHSYFENKELIHMLFSKEQITLFEETNPESLRDIHPRAIILDAVCNDPSLATTNLSALYQAVSALPHIPYLLIDISATTVIDFPLPWKTRLGFLSKTLLVESLNKYHQYGLDRVTGGILTGFGISWDHLYRVRDHLGVNIPESSAAALPNPNKELMKRYIHRLQSNAIFLKKELGQIQGISVSLAEENQHIRGTFLAVQGKTKSVMQYRKIINLALREATKRHVPLIAGTTFGTPVTRMYTWSTRSPFERPFLRISPGLESDVDCKKVAAILQSVLRLMH